MADIRAAGPFVATRGPLARAARFSTLNIRLTVLICVVLIAGCFAAAATLQMRADRVHALNQAAYFEARRARDVAVLVDSALDRDAAIGRIFAEDVTRTDLPTLAGLKNIAVFDQDATPVAVLHGTLYAFPQITPETLLAAHHMRVVEAPSIAAFPDNGRVVALYFDPATIVPSQMLDRAELTAADGVVLAQGPQWTGRVISVSRAGSWPVGVRTTLDEESALEAWYGSMPLYLFVILGPALVGAGLAAVFVREFERRARAYEAIRTLKSARPLEARLLVRLAEAERRAAESARSKSEFIAHMSHELRTPLNAIIGFSEVIEHGFYGEPGHPKYVEYARDIGMAGRSLHAKIGDILEFANVEAGRFPIKPARFDVSELALDCVNEHMGRAFSRRISLELGVVEPAETTADPQATKRILANLLSNALLYTPENGMVRVHVSVDEGAIVVAVCDTGNGFTREEYRRIGGAFLRFDRSGAATGAGMGLAIAMALAHRMGGAIRIAGRHGEGTAAELRLPKA
jgi:signal transduction histidine kinase